MKHPHPSPCAPQPLPSPQDTRAAGREGRAQAQPHLTHLYMREEFSTATTRRSTYPFSPEEGARESLPMHGLGKWVPSPVSPGCLVLPPPGSAWPLPDQETEARAPFFPARSLSTQQPLLPQALTSQHQHCSFSFTARGSTQCHLCCRQDGSRHFPCGATRCLQGRLCQQ